MVSYKTIIFIEEYTLKMPINEFSDTLITNITGQKSFFPNSVNNAATAFDNAAFTDVGVTGVDSRFYPGMIIDASRWDQLIPYRFVVIDTRNKNSIVGGGAGASAAAQIQQEKGSTLIKFTPINGQWQFILPITPQQLSITDQYAINTSATLRGVLEEHNGLKFKNILINSTMGVWPYRNSVDSASSNNGTLNSIFSNTINAAQSFGDQVNRIINTATNNHPASQPQTNSPAQGVYTGFHMAVAFQQFLEQYAEAKKDPKNVGWRLVLDIPKQNQSLVVTPMQFSWQQSENKPMLVNYTLQLKAWRRIDLKTSIVETSSDFSLTPNILQKILNTVTEARKSVSAYINLIGAIRSDVEKPLDILRQTSLFIKDLSGAVVTVADLPSQVIDDYSSGIKDAISINKDAIKNTSSNSSVREQVDFITASVQQNEGLTMDNISSGQIGSQAILAQSIDPSNNVFSNSNANFSLFDLVPVNSLSLTNSQQNNVTNIINNARTTTVDDLRIYRGTIQDLVFQLSNYFGVGDAYYNSVYGKPAPKIRLQPLTLNEYQLLNSLYDVIQSYDTLTATTQIDDLNTQTNMDYVAGLASSADIQFNISQSKILVPVPFGLTMEQIAARYLKDPQRWLEIATLNNLREPYIDGTGFQRSLLSNGSMRDITINSVDDMYEGQKISLRSSTQVPSNRTVLNIKRLSDTSFLLTLDGEPNLDNFKIADGAYVQAYLPGTVNSQQKIFIPSTLAVSEDPNIIVPSLASGDPLTGLSKVDLLLTDYGDLATDNFGDFKISYGLTNIIQCLKIKMGTQKGTNLLHPDFGLGIAPGISSAEVNITDIYSSINQLIAQDSRFDGLSNLQIQLNGSALMIDMGVRLAAQRGVFPIRFQLGN
jgi:hypothetical protein